MAAIISVVITDWNAPEGSSVEDTNMDIRPALVPDVASLRAAAVS
jgi:hypothetical protein